MTTDIVLEIANMQWKIDKLEALFDNLLLSIRNGHVVDKIKYIDSWGYEETIKFLMFIEAQHPQLFDEFQDYKSRESNDSSAHTADTKAAKGDTKTALRLIRSCFSRHSSSSR